MLDDLLDRAVGTAHARHRLGARLAQRVGLRLAPAFGHRLGEVREEHREPEEHGDQAGEHVLARGRLPEVAEEEDRGEHAADLDDEHHRVARHRARVQLHEAVDERAPDDRRASNSRVGAALGETGHDSLTAPLRSSELLDDGTEREHGEVREPDDDDDHRYQQSGEQRRVRSGTCPPTSATRCLRTSDPAIASTRDHQEEATDQHADPERRVEPVRCCPTRPGERRAVVVRRRRERVDHLGEAVRTRVEDRLHRRVHDHRRRPRSTRITSGTSEEVEHDELHLGALDLLAEVLRRASDHEAGDEHREEGEHEHAVQARADAARAHLAEHHVDERHHPADRREAVVARVHRAGRRVASSTTAKSPDAAGPKRISLPSMLPPDCVAVACWLTPRGVELRVAVRLDHHRDRAGRDPEDRPSPRARRSPASCRFAIFPNVHASENGMTSSRKISSEVRERVRVLERVRRVRVVEPAAVGAELLDRFLARHGPAGIVCVVPSTVFTVSVAVEVLHHALADEERAPNTIATGSEDPGRSVRVMSTQKLPIVPLPAAHDAADRARPRRRCRPRPTRSSAPRARPSG